jgi:NAD-dependent protein deacetylase/lipoamidase
MPRTAERLPIGADTRLLVLTGAGVSAESGIPTFRDGNGLWENHRVEDVASPEGWARDPVLVWSFYSKRRAAAKASQPNAGHRALAAVEAQLGDRFLLVTQNVDGLHRRAGSQRLIEMHGNLFLTRCSRCQRAPFPEEALHERAPLPECEECGERGRRALLRPHIVWFGEALFPDDMQRIQEFVRGAQGHPLLFLAVGTSGLVYPAAGLVHLAKQSGAEAWLVNAEPAENGAAFDRFERGKSAELLPELLGVPG